MNRSGAETLNFAGAHANQTIESIKRQKRSRINKRRAITGLSLPLSLSRRRDAQSRRANNQNLLNGRITKDFREALLYLIPKRLGRKSRHYNAEVRPPIVPAVRTKNATSVQPRARKIVRQKRVQPHTASVIYARISTERPLERAHASARGG